MVSKSPNFRLRICRSKGQEEELEKIDLATHPPHPSLCPVCIETGAGWHCPSLSLSFHSHYCHICPTAEQNRTSPVRPPTPTARDPHIEPWRSSSIHGDYGWNAESDRPTPTGRTPFLASLPLFVIFFSPPHSMIAKKAAYYIATRHRPFDVEK